MRVILIPYYIASHSFHFPSASPLTSPHLQADVCHAYQILHAHGVSDDHIVVMMYNDIAYNEE